ncbi:MAG: HD domain-containing protein [Myxococcales bacterium]|nr:HD domain-containing protein [Myxococcales bacterium]
MEIRDPIHGNISVSDGEQAIIESPFFRRLRRIKQLGFADMVFPGAVHTRFLHSIGVMHLAGQAFDAVFRDATWFGADDRARLRQTLRLAALCHDTGHAPLSHTSEALFPTIAALAIPHMDAADSTKQARHEHYTFKLLMDSELTPVVEQAFGPMGIAPHHIAALLYSGITDADDAFAVSGRNLRGVLSAICSSELDVDRMDYLLRDSYFSGVSYGKFDHDWLIGHLTYYEADNGRVYLALEDSALYTFDDFLLSRYHMFLMVYFHYKVECFDQMLKRFYEQTPDFTVPPSPGDFLEFDDPAVFRQLQKGAARSRWARGILQGRPLSCVAERGWHERWDDLTELEARLDDAGLDYVHVTSKSAVSKYRGKADPERQIFVRIQPRIGQPRFRPLGEATKLFARYEDTTFMERTYVHAEDVAVVTPWISDLRDNPQLTLTAQ